MSPVHTGRCSLPTSQLGQTALAIPCQHWPLPCACSTSSTAWLAVPLSLESGRVDAYNVYHAASAGWPQLRCAGSVGCGSRHHPGRSFSRPTDHLQQLTQEDYATADTAFQQLAYDAKLVVQSCTFSPTRPVNTGQLRVAE